jgi:hypothetical protein
MEVLPSRLLSRRHDGGGLGAPLGHAAIDSFGELLREHASYVS